MKVYTKAWIACPGCGKVFLDYADPSWKKDHLGRHVARCPKCGGPAGRRRGGDAPGQRLLFDGFSDQAQTTNKGRPRDGY